MKLFSRHIGNGWPLIIVHGLYGSSDNWLSVAKRLEKHFSIHLIDLRNHGNSPHSSDHSYEAMALDLDEFIEDKGLKMPILVGHSMGGKVVMQYGLMFPEKVQRMLVVDISPLANSEVHHKQHIFEHKNIISALRNLPLGEIESRKEADNTLSERIPSERIRSFLLKNLTRIDHKLTWKLNLDVLATQVEGIMNGFDIKNPAHTNQRNFPVLFIKGNKSDYIDKDDEKAILQFYPESKLTGIDNAGHWVHAEQQDEFIKVLMEFCRSEADFL